MAVEPTNPELEGGEAAFYSPADLQRRWGVSRSMAYKTLRSVGFPAPLKIGRSLRYAKEDVHAWEARMTQAGQD